ncbi:MAG TPA: MetQ/NlpA family ABC transporter substrate-binding protein, partial [Glaciihabitans sp.]|nr:MetQ/NlpA family ABC transporter substrate-binding protein [Glaciihabitans sp.]
MRFTSRNARLAGAAVATVLLVSACASEDTAPAADGSDGLGTITVGALPVPAGDILTFVQENLAEDAGLTIEIEEFSDYNTPNTAVSDGSIDANLFQNSTFLETYNDQAGDSLVSLGEVYLPSAAFYSDKVDELDELENGAEIGIPSDPTNEGR